MAKRDKRTIVADWHLWREVAKTVVPLRQSDRLELEDQPLPLPQDGGKPAVRQAGHSWQPDPPPFQSPHPDLPPSARTPPGTVIEPNLKKRLQRGRITIDGRIDLHGMRQLEARDALGRFILARAQRGDRTLLVITGKGLKKLDAGTIIERGVLRAMLPMWLSEPTLAPYVAGWDVAAQGHGGEGAFYVRLRRPGGA